MEPASTVRRSRSRSLTAADQRSRKEVAEEAAEATAESAEEVTDSAVVTGAEADLDLVMAVDPVEGREKEDIAEVATGTDLAAVTEAMEAVTEATEAERGATVVAAAAAVTAVVAETTVKVTATTTEAAALKESSLAAFTRNKVSRFLEQDSSH